jgi:hypothetical protein
VGPRAIRTRQLRKETLPLPKMEHQPDSAIPVDLAPIYRKQITARLEHPRVRAEEASDAYYCSYGKVKLSPCFN